MVCFMSSGCGQYELRPYLIRIWREWIIEGDKFVGMHFTLGESCGKTDRETKVTLVTVVTATPSQ